MRRIQSLRKNAGLEKKDRVAVIVKAEEEVVQFCKNWENVIQEKVGASTLTISSEHPAKVLAHTSAEKVRGKEFYLWLEQV